MNKKIIWHKIADSFDEINFAENGITTIEVNNKTICIAKYNNELFGCAAKCPHASGNMEHGHIDTLGNIVCPLHRYKFNLQNGRNTSGEGYYLKTYPIEKKENGIYVGIEESGFFSWIK